MTVSLLDILVAPEWARPEAKDRVIRYLRDLPLEPAHKRKLLGRWGREVSAVLVAEDFDRLRGGA
ncbi:MAG: hypothetical protein ACRD2T_12285 [Thermoanaerobaculia bacterium]